MAIALVASMVPAGTAAASSANLNSDQVAAEIIRVQAKADKTAQRWSAAEIHLQDVAAQIQATQDAVAATSAHYADLQAALARVVIDRFTSGSVPSILLVASDETEALQIDALKSIVLDTGSADLDTVDAVRSDLQNQEAHLDALNVENAQVLADLTARKSEIDSQLAELSSLRERLKEAEVKRAYDAQLAKQRQDEANAAAARDAQAAAQRDALAAATAGPLVQARGSGLAPPPSTQPAVSSPDANPSSQPPAADVASSPPAPPAPTITARSWICPVAGPTAFGDTFGAARPGGRRHEGVDMMSALGTPLVAVVAGQATMKVTSLGGNSISLAGDDGNGYFYAHLSSWAGTSRTVAAGEVIGYVGHTGDTTANHLHFEIHPGGGVAVDPTPTVRQFC